MELTLDELAYLGKIMQAQVRKEQQRVDRYVTNATTHTKPKMYDRAWMDLARAQSILALAEGNYQDKKRAKLERIRSRR